MCRRAQYWDTVIPVDLLCLKVCVNEKQLHSMPTTLMVQVEQFAMCVCVCVSFELYDLDV